MEIGAIGNLAAALCVFTTLGCAGTPADEVAGLAAPSGQAASVTTSSRANGSLRLVVRAEKIVDSAITPLGACGELVNNDRVVLHVKTDRTAFVYVIYLAADGQVSQLYPELGEDARVSASTETALPALRVTDPAGEENIYVIASGDTLEQADRAVNGVLSLIRSDANVRYRTATTACVATKPAVSAPSQASASASSSAQILSTARASDPSIAGRRARRIFPLVPRGIVRDHDDATKAVQVDASGGLAIFHLPLQHLAP